MCRIDVGRGSESFVAPFFPVFFFSYVRKRTRGPFRAPAGRGLKLLLFLSRSNFKRSGEGCPHNEIAGTGAHVIYNLLDLYTKDCFAWFVRAGLSKPEARTGVSHGQLP